MNCILDLYLWMWIGYCELYFGLVLVFVDVDIIVNYILELYLYLWMWIDHCELYFGLVFVFVDVDIIVNHNLGLFFFIVYVDKLS